MNRTERPEILGGLSSLADLARCRILLLLEGRELSVSELCEVLRMPQSTVSRHLRALSDDGWVEARREGTRRWYALRAEALGEGRRTLWEVVRGSVRDTPPAGRDRARLAPVLARRRARSQEFFRGAAADWDRVRDRLFGTGFVLHALPALLPPGWTVGDLGCGTGPVAEALAPHVTRVIAVDESREMIEEARRRLAAHPNVELKVGELEALPLGDASVDAATLVLVLHHLADPARALAEAARVLRPGGRLLLVDMLPHERTELAERMGHVWLGFSEQALARYLREAGFGRAVYRPLAQVPDAEGPALFAAVARKPSATVVETEAVDAAAGRA